MVVPATTASAAIWLNSDFAYAKEAKAPSVDLKKVRESVMDLIEEDESRRGDGSKFWWISLWLWELALIYSSAEKDDQNMIQLTLLYVLDYP